MISLYDVETAEYEGLPLMKISGSGGGYTVTVQVSELKLEEIRIGQTVKINSWFGDAYEGQIVSVSDYPSSADLGDSGMNVSYYPVDIAVDASADMADAYWVEVDLGSRTESSGSFYLYKAFVLTENGKSYVYLQNAEGLLEKRFLTTGRDLYGYETEILEGLSREDYIAFPYAKTSEEGAKTEIGSLMELYGY